MPNIWPSSSYSPSAPLSSSWLPWGGEMRPTKATTVRLLLNNWQWAAAPQSLSPLKINWESVCFDLFPRSKTTRRLTAKWRPPPPSTSGLVLACSPQSFRWFSSFSKVSFRTFLSWIERVEERTAFGKGEVTPKLTGRGRKGIELKVPFVSMDEGELFH